MPGEQFPPLDTSVGGGDVSMGGMQSPTSAQHANQAALYDARRRAGLSAQTMEHITQASNCE